VKKLVLVVMALILCVLAFAALGQAQTVPGPRVTLAFDVPMGPSCEAPTGSVNQWNLTYGPCYTPAGQNAGDPFIQQVRVSFAGATNVSTLVPRAQVTLETTAARCGSGSVPCLRISDLPAPAGPSNVTLNLIDGEARAGGASTAVPFTGNQPLVPAGAGLRVIPNP
jgi:hypothetical protein